MSNNIIDTVKVRYNFEGDDSSELTIKKNDIIDVIVKDPSGWADGILRSTNKRGWFPMQYTKSILDHDNMKLPLEKNSKENDMSDIAKAYDFAKAFDFVRNNGDSMELMSSNWKKKKTINGKKYYINIETNETTYNKSKTLRRADINQINRNLQTINSDASTNKPETQPIVPKRSEKIKNLQCIINSSLSNLNNISGDGLNHKSSSKSNSATNINNNNNNNNEEKESPKKSRPTSSDLPSNANRSSYDSDSSSLSNSIKNSCASINQALSNSREGINMATIATAAASIASSHGLFLSGENINTNNNDGSLKKTNLSLSTSTFHSYNQLPSPQTATTSSNLIDKLKKIEISKSELSKKNGVDKAFQKIIQLFVDFIQSLVKNKKITYLDQCFEIKNSLKKFFISLNILNQDGNIITTSSSQINLYYSTMLALSKMILNVRDAVGQWPPPDVNQMIFIQIEDFTNSFQLLLNTLNLLVDNNDSEIKSLSPINTNPSFLTTTIENSNSNSILTKINQQISIIMMSISDLIILCRREHTMNPNIYKVAINCRDNISVLANEIDEIQLKRRKTHKYVVIFLNKKESLMNCIKELTITIKSSNEKFAPSNSLELIIESLANCINIIDDISSNIRGVFDLSDSTPVSQNNSFDNMEIAQQDTYEQNKKIFGDQNAVINNSFSKKLEKVLKKKEITESKSAVEPPQEHFKFSNSSLNKGTQNNSELSLNKDQAFNPRLFKAKSNPKGLAGSRSKINKFFGEDDADIENEKLNNLAPKPAYLMADYPKGSITYNMEGQINGATLSSYIEYVTSHENDDSDLDQKTLILMYDQFCSVSEFIELLTKRYFIKPPENLDKDNLKEWKTLKQIPIQNKVLAVINQWLSYYWNNNDSDYLPKIIDFLTVASNPLNQSYSDNAIDILFKAKKMNSKPKDNRTIKFIMDDNYPHPIIPKTPQDKITFLDIDPVEFTRQMCLLEMEAYFNILPYELMVVNKKNSKSESIKMMTKISIRITQFIITAILSDPDPKKRNTILRHTMNILKKSFEERNFDLVFSVIAALNSSAIVRLSKTWSLLPTKFKDALEYFQNQISHNKNYQKYRHILKTCEKPCIPFFGIILKDITFTEDGNSQYRKETLINISKFRNLAMIVEDYNSFKIPYNFKEVPVIQNWLHTNIIDVDEKDEQDLYNLSLKIEPRENVNFSQEII